jgi:hypothetical protein
MGSIQNRRVLLTFDVEGRRRMFILRRLKEASVEHLGVYRSNAWLLTLKQNIGPFLKGELSSEVIFL